MKETDYFTIDNEVFINSKSNENTDEFLQKATNELLLRSEEFKRKCQTKEFIDIKGNVIAAICMFIFMSGLLFAGILLTILLDWGCFMVIIVAAIFIIIWFVVYMCNIKKLRSLERIIDRSEICVGKVTRTKIQFFGSSLEYKFFSAGKEFNRSAKVSNKIFRRCIRNPYVFILFDETTMKSFPVRLFIKKV